MEEVLMLKKVIKITPRSFAEHSPLGFNSFHTRLILSFFSGCIAKKWLAERGSQMEIYEANLGQLFKLHYSSTLMRKISPASYKLKGIFLTNFSLSHSISMRRLLLQDEGKNEWGKMYNSFMKLSEWWCWWDVH